MTKTVEFYYDYPSPYTYLAHKQMKTLGAPVTYRPMHILGVMKLVGNIPSPQCPPKGRYAGMDAARWAKRLGIPMTTNADFWAALLGGKLDSTLLTKGAMAAQDLGVADAYNDAIFDAIWKTPRDIVSAEGRNAVLADAGIAGKGIWEKAETPEFRERLEAETKAAAARGVFGTPTFFVGDDIFFGNDRLDFVREAAAA
ncbi:2-hydroxychromene-2-carboxylate isomerase [Parvibaculum sp.]|uniref:2-hydroxychromene-2-carboxylate isomerase n=1 Tax=Parvibaculum sp. TaxID=2024848 RepID=UPI001D7D0397|nr:2-hydroxychromene-2-carboxylate isomerase [Parvibaculum sp.]MBX3489856.1 2-hydroxychromene-2-carboxylate isomerase [Parvibaculum sp.]MCW5726156.1 2-hydroxychromene-2-carboxylate isomerase [Parvibaculum sp.]